MKNFENVKDAFYDEFVQVFCYDIFNKRIELHFKRYYDSSIESYKEVPCIFIIENWQWAHSIPYVDDIPISKRRRYKLDSNMSIFFMIMDMKVEAEWFEITINTIDERYVTYLFENPQLSIVEK